MEILHKLLPRRGFVLPQFDLPSLEFDSEHVEASDELPLDGAVASIGAAPPIVRLVEPMPTAGELQAAIERHLHGSEDSSPPIDPADELRNALADLRRSLG